MVKTSDNFALNMMNLCEMTILSEFMHKTVVYIITFGSYYMRNKEQ